MANQLNNAPQDRQFSEAFDRFYPFIFKFCCARLSGNCDLAEDCAQEAFYVFFCKLRDGVQIENPKAYLVKTANLIVMNRRTKQTAERARTAEEAAALQLVSAERAEAKPEFRDLTAYILKNLNKADGEVFRLRYLQGMSLAEIAGQTGNSITALTSRLSRMRIKLRQIIEEYGVIV